MALAAPRQRASDMSGHPSESHSPSPNRKQHEEVNAAITCGYGLLPVHLIGTAKLPNARTARIRHATGPMQGRIRPSKSRGGPVEPAAGVTRIAQKWQRSSAGLGQTRHGEHVDPGLVCRQTARYIFCDS